jgi:hypothetical protein
MTINLDPVREFPVTVPTSFSLAKARRKVFTFWDNRITDDRYPLRTDLLDKTFTVEILQVTAEGRLDEDFILSAKEDGYVLPGVIGAVLLPDQCRAYLNWLRYDIPAMCLDEKDFLYKKEGAYRVPYFNREEKSFSLHVAKMKCKLFVGTYIVLFKQ